MENPISLRSHHFLCLLGFQGKGYSPKFVRNFQKVFDHTQKSEDISFQVVQGADRICAPCPNRRSRGCTQEEKIQQLDRNHSEALELKEGEVLSWKDAKKRIASRLTLQRFHQICSGCEWKKLGYCETALKKLLGGALMGLLFIFSTPTFAEEKQTPLTEEPRFIDDLMESLKKKSASPSSEKVIQIYKALKSRQYKDLEKSFRQLLETRSYEDWGYYLAGVSAFDQSQEFLRQKKTSQALGKLQESRTHFVSIFRDTPSSPLKERADWELALVELNLAKIDFSKKQWNSATRFFENAFERLFPKNRLIMSVSYEWVQNYAQLCSKQETFTCRAWVRRFYEAFPENSPERLKMDKLKLRFALKNTPPSVFDRLNQSYPGPNQDDELIEAALTLYRKKEYDTAIERFQEFLSKFPKSMHRHRAAYWMAKALYQEGENQRGAQIFQSLISQAPLAYYGLLAAYETQQKMELFLDASVPRAASSDPALRPDEELRIRRSEEFLRLGYRELAALELNGFRPRKEFSNDFIVFISALQSEVGNHLDSFAFLTELFNRAYLPIQASYALRLIFPVTYQKVILKYAQKDQIDPILVLSLTKQESAFDQNARSSSGAMGLMQMMPFTAIDVDPTLFQMQVVDPEENIRLGVRYLSRLLKKFNGNIALALAGYNAGPTRAAEWQAKMDPQWGLIEFIEAIPFRETRGYVSSIVRNYFWYTYRIHGRRLKNLDYFWGKPLAFEGNP